MNWPRLSYLAIHQLWHKVTSCTQYFICKNEIVVAFGLAHFPGPFYLGFISSHFFLLTILFFLPFDFSFRVYPFYIFLNFFFFDNMETFTARKG